MGMKNGEQAPHVAVQVLPRGGELERELAASILLGDDRGRGVAENIRNMAEREQRSAHWAGLYADIVGWRGTKEQAVAYVVAQLGCSVDSARDAVQQFSRTPRDPHEIYAQCRAYCDWYEANLQTVGTNGHGENAGLEVIG